MAHLIVQDYRVVTPAYGRDYSKAADAVADFVAGKDFVLQPENLYCSVVDFEKGILVNIRFKKNTRVVTTQVS